MSSYGVSTHPDTSTDDRGPWISTSTGGRYYYETPQPEDIRISDIANGLAKEPRYAGQTDINLNYTVAEHCIHMTRYAFDNQKWGPRQALCCLLHDAFEAYGKDMPSPIKGLLGERYGDLEHKGLVAILDRWDLRTNFENCLPKIKEFDRKMLNVERPQVFRHPIDWGYDQSEMLEGIDLKFWSTPAVKAGYIKIFELLMEAAKIPIKEEIEI